MLWNGPGLVFVLATIVAMSISDTARDWLALVFPVLMVIAIIAGRRSKGEEPTLPDQTNI